MSLMLPFKHGYHERNTFKHLIPRSNKTRKRRLFIPLNNITYMKASLRPNLIWHIFGKNYCKLEQKPILMANIINGQYFQTSRISDFGLIKMRNMSNFWFANNKFNLLRWNKKHFSWFFKGFQLPEIVSDLRLRL